MILKLEYLGKKFNKLKNNACVKGSTKKYTGNEVSVHEGKKDFTCQICDKAFSRKDHLQKHS